MGGGVNSSQDEHHLRQREAGPEKAEFRMWVSEVGEKGGYLLHLGHLSLDHFGLISMVAKGGSQEGDAKASDSRHTLAKRIIITCDVCFAPN